jgi:hypothetical protein
MTDRATEPVTSVQIKEGMATRIAATARGLALKRQVLADLLDQPDGPLSLSQASTR